MEAPHRHEFEPIASSNERSVQVFSSTVRIQQLVIDRPAVAAYLGGIANDKQELALIHALEDGVTELVARRRRFKA